MTTRPAASVIDDRVEPLLEEFLAEVVTGFRPESKGSEAQSITAVLTEAAMASFSRAVTQASPVERALLAEALSPALAGALAPALAKELAPEIVTALSHLVAAAESSGDEPAASYPESEAAYDAGPEGR
ncbi:MAG: hypothetical protein ACRDRV_05180 [Pseudonocardiaceae bacterium]